MTDGMARSKLVVDLEPDQPTQAWPDRWSLEYLLASYDEASHKRRREELRDQLKDWIISNCDPDESGNYHFMFEKPVIIDSQVFAGLTAQRRVSEFINEDRAFEIADKYDVRDQVVREVITEELDLDAMYALNQRGIISDEDIDSILDLRETFALVKIEEEQ